MITKEFKSVVVLVILGYIAAKKRIFNCKKIFIASLRGNLTSNHYNSIRFMLPDPITIEKLAPKCYSWNWLLKWFIFKFGLPAILYLGHWYQSWRNGTKCIGIFSCLGIYWLINMTIFCPNIIVKSGWHNY